MSVRSDWDVLVIGSGPAGLAAAAAAADNGASVAVIEREDRPGGILKQCIHDGFGLLRYGEKLTGPEYAWRCLSLVEDKNIPILTETYLNAGSRTGDGFTLDLVNSREGEFNLGAKALVFATGCRERTARQVFIHGTRPAGVLTAGLAQYFINIQGYMPGKKCVLLGSGDIGLIMARRLVLEGAEVEGVYEVLPEPSGLIRNVVQCLEDYRIPLHMSSTVLRVHGRDRVEGVTIVGVDERRRPLPGTQRYIPCDSLILSVGLIPENECVEALGADMNRVTLGPEVDQSFMSIGQNGVFSCGNALHVSDLVDYVSDTGDKAGAAAARHALSGPPGRNRKRIIPFSAGRGVRYVVPQYIDPDNPEQPMVFFRSSETLENARVRITSGSRVILEKRYPVLRPPEMERLTMEIPDNANKLELSIDRRESG